MKSFSIFGHGTPTDISDRASQFVQDKFVKRRVIAGFETAVEWDLRDAPVTTEVVGFTSLYPKLRDVLLSYPHHAKRDMGSARASFHPAYPRFQWPRGYRALPSDIRLIYEEAVHALDHENKWYSTSAYRSGQNRWASEGLATGLDAYYGTVIAMKEVERYLQRYHEIDGKRDAIIGNWRLHWRHIRKGDWKQYTVSINLGLFEKAYDAVIGMEKERPLRESDLEDVTQKLGVRVSCTKILRALSKKYKDRVIECLKCPKGLSEVWK